MIVNWSRLSNFGKCPERAWNWDHEHLEQWAPEFPLLQGSGFHEGVARFFARKDPFDAEQAVEEKMRSELEGKTVFPEDKPTIDHAIAWTKMAVAKFADNYQREPVQVLWPEVTFCVPIPNTEHCCYEFHKRFCQGEPFHEHQSLCAEALKVWGPQSQTLQNLPCWQPHWFRGKTDAVVQYLGDVWLFEHKTNSQQIEQLVNRFFLDAQPTGYLYGIWKSMGVLPAGFILNVIQKPARNARDQMQVGFAREIFQRCQEDLQVWEGEFAQQASDYERAFRDRELGNPFAVVRRTTSCLDYGRKCPYFSMCQRHPREPLEGEFHQRAADYVELSYQELYAKWKEQHATT